MAGDDGRPMGEVMSDERPPSIPPWKATRGRPSKLNPQLQEAICVAIRTTKMSLRDAATSCGIDEGTAYDWMEKGRKSQKGPHREFYLAVKRARADGTKMLLARIAKAGTENKHWQANAHLLSVTEPQYSPRVRVSVEKELSQAIDRVEKEFAAEPELLARVLACLASDNEEEEAHWGQNL